MPVTKFELEVRRPLAGGKLFGEVGEYEELRGKLFYDIDPSHDANNRVGDISLAQTNAAGRVEFLSDVVILKPVDASKGNGRVLFDVLNRGKRLALAQFNNAPPQKVTYETARLEEIEVGHGWLMDQGFTVIWAGWQADVPPFQALLRLTVPEAMDTDGRRLTGKIFSQFQAMEHVDNFMLSDRDHTPHPALEMEQPDALLTVRDQPDSDSTTVSRDEWRFGRVVDGEYVEDPSYVTMNGGFEPGLMYQFTYTTVGAPVMGLGFLAMRDSISWLKYASESEGNPSAGHINHAYGFGVSQSGRFLRNFIYLDLNLDEEGREAFDGIIPHVPGGMRGEFNQRFGQPSKDLPTMMAQLFPFTPGESVDPVTEERGSLMQRVADRDSSLKVFFSNTAAEYWRSDASLVHTDPDATVDVDPPANARIYALAGCQHGHGDWPPTDRRSADNLRGQNLVNSIDYAPLMRAQLENLHQWAVNGVQPPDSQYPRLDDETGATAEQVSAKFDAIPNSNRPPHIPIPKRIDFGRNDDETLTRMLPPVTGKSYGAIVSDVDDDGNEISGLMLPDILVPLATSTPWNLRHPTMGAPDQVIGLTGGLTGSTLPFPLTREQRVDSADPRMSVHERYESKKDYLEQVRSAAEVLVEQREILEYDVERCVNRAGERWDWFTSRTA